MLAYPSSVRLPKFGCRPRVRHSLCLTLRVASDTMNPNRHRATELRRRAIEDQIAGLERLVAAGQSEPHQTQRLADTRAEFVTLSETLSGHSDSKWVVVVGGL